MLPSAVRRTNRTHATTTVLTTERRPYCPAVYSALLRCTLQSYFDFLVHWQPSSSTPPSFFGSHAGSASRCSSSANLAPMMTVFFAERAGTNMLTSGLMTFAAGALMRKFL